MSWIDLVIVVVVIAATDRGLSLGVFRQLGTLVGLVTGFIVGTLLVPTFATRIAATPGRVTVSVLTVVAFSFLGLVIGGRVGSWANTSLRRLKLGWFDKIGGAAFAAVGSLVVCWLVAGLLVNVNALSLGDAIANSKLLAVMDAVMPPVPAVEAKVQTLFANNGFPGVFATVVAPSVTPVTTPGPAATSHAVSDSASSVLRVTALAACGVSHEGTAFVVGANLVMTAAHVVAGSANVIVGGHRATTLVYDPANDVAILSVPTGGYRELGFVIPTPANGTAAAVVGYPLNGPRLIVPAAISGVLNAQGRDIYNGQVLSRSLVVINATVRPGNSGSPLFVLGRIAAMVFSRSTTHPDVAYAVPADVLRLDVSHAAGHHPVSNGACLAA